jgi:hypothetical protein
VTRVNCRSYRYVRLVSRYDPDGRSGLTARPLLASYGLCVGKRPQAGQSWGASQRLQGELGNHPRPEHQCLGTATARQTDRRRFATWRGPAGWRCSVLPKSQYCRPARPAPVATPANTSMRARPMRRPRDATPSVAPTYSTRSSSSATPKPSRCRNPSSLRAGWQGSSALPSAATPSRRSSSGSRTATAATALVPRLPH